MIVSLLSFPDGLPRTIHFRLESWWNQSWGFHDVERHRVEGVTAISADGSRASRFEWAHWRFHVIPAWHFSGEFLYLRPQHTMYTVDPAKKEILVTPCSCTWNSEGLPFGDPGCTQTANRLLGGAKDVGEATIAGVRVIRFRATEAVPNRLWEISLAPDHGCDLLEELEQSFNWFGLPTSSSHLVVTRYIPGQPAPEFFALPAGYTVRQQRVY